MEEAELHLPPRVQYVGLARQVVKAAARKAGLGEERVADLEIAVSEATTNAMLAQNRAGSGRAVVLAFGVSAGHFQVEVRDVGPGFDPSSHMDQEVRDWQVEGGLGLTVIRGLADDVEFLREEGMRVSMRFSFDTESAPAANHS